MSSANDPRWNAVTDRLSHRMVELSPEPAAATPTVESSSGARTLASAEEEARANRKSKREEALRLLPQKPADPVFIERINALCDQAVAELNEIMGSGDWNI